MVTLAHGYSFESTKQELSNDTNMTGFRWIFKNLWVLMQWSKVAIALEGLKKTQCKPTRFVFKAKYV